MLNVSATFDLQKDVVSNIFKKEASVGLLEEYSRAVDTQIINIERDGGVLYSWKGATGTTQIGKYDPTTKHNKLLYKFDKQVCVSSCSLNKEETLLAVSLVQRTRAEERLKPVSKCLTLLIEIHPINNTKVLKAVDCKIRVQFLYPETNRSSVLESHLLLLADEGYVEQYHVMLSKQEGYRVVMCNFERMAKDRVVEDFMWTQWDAHTQRLFYLTYRDKAVLVCVQFYPNHNCETVFELALDLPSNPITSLRFINLGFDHYQEEEPVQCDPIRMAVFTNTIGSMCVCYSQQITPHQASCSYTIVLVHKGCSKTFTVALDGDISPHTRDLHPLFLPLGYYILVYLPGHFLHCINSRQQESLCHSLFLSGPESDLGLPAEGAVVFCLPDSTSLLDLAAGRMFSLDISSEFLLQLLQTPGPSRPDNQRLAVLHCLLVYLGPNPALEQRIIDWICDNIMPFPTFDQIQEFVLASLYRIVCNKSLSLDKVLPYTSVSGEKDLPASLDKVPGVMCSTQLNAEPLFSKKHSWSLPGYWEDLQWSSERIQYFEAVPSPRFRTQQLQQDSTFPAPGPGREPVCQALEAAVSTQPSQKKSGKKRASGSHTACHIEENTKKVLSVVDTWCRDKKLVPLFQEEDHQQRVLIGQMVDKLKEHLIRHLPRLGKKRIDLLVVNYVAKLLELIRYMLESVWLKYRLAPCVMCLKKPGSPAEWTVFHVMCRILEATKSLCLPLPPGYHTLLAVLGVRCLPRHMFLQYVDQGLLQLTETFVSCLMTDLDNSHSNEQLKFSILKRLPEPMEQRICHLWDHPVSSACISRGYVSSLLKKQANTKRSQFMDRGRPGFRPDFLPLTYLTNTLAALEEEALNPFEEQENIDARFVEETALKQTLILLGFEVK
ncbi:gamma-secretase-activating protein isoform X1 [Osmerus mordax]|uniref:gamma-secretase-activating protein isoform X1 n=1 Tax=Osmerus mordax TaxID=8014 RepID=UPI00350F9237